jgi:hypothetical protein
VIRAAFTLMEVLVSLAIFMVVGLAMVLTLAMGTEIFRLGEASRNAGDEAMAALAALQDDLDHMSAPRWRTVQYVGAGAPPPQLLPDASSGWFFAKVLDQSGGAGSDPLTRGDCFVAWVIRQPDRGLVAHNWGAGGDPLGNDRAIVCWWLAHDGVLRRHLIPITSRDGQTERNKAYAIANRWDERDDGQPIVSGVLHFSIWAAIADQPSTSPVRTVGQLTTVDWERIQDNGAGGRNQTACAPWNGRDLDSAVGQVPAFPDQVRFALILSGSGRAPADDPDQDRGLGVRAEVDLLDDTSSPPALRLRGGRGLPAKGYLRVLNLENRSALWLRYANLSGGIVELDPDAANRGALRTRWPGELEAGQPVAAGRMYSLVRSLPTR